VLRVTCEQDYKLNINCGLTLLLCGCVSCVGTVVETHTSGSAVVRCLLLWYCVVNDGVVCYMLILISVRAFVCMICVGHCFGALIDVVMMYLAMITGI